MRIDLYLHDEQTDGQLQAGLAHVTQQLERIMATLADIQAAVAAEQTVEQGVITLLQQLSTDLKAALAGNDPAAMQAIVDQLDQNAAALSAAVTANTPAAPNPAPTPTPTPAPGTPTS